MYSNFDEFPYFTFFRFLGKMESVWLDGKMDNVKAVYALKTLFCRGYNSGKNTFLMDGKTDGWTDGQTDGHENRIPPLKLCLKYNYNDAGKLRLNNKMKTGLEDWQ